MELFVWKKTYEIGHHKVDEQHRNLIGVINELARSMVQQEGPDCVESILERLESHIQLHFKTEEELMEKVDFFEIEEHRLKHLEFTRKVLELKRKYSQNEEPTPLELLSFLCSWWKNHIVAEDKKIVSYAKAQRKTSQSL